MFSCVCVNLKEQFGDGQNQPDSRDLVALLWRIHTCILHSSYVIILPKTNYFIIYCK